MQLENFTSLFELFATLSVVYALLDEIMRNRKSSYMHKLEKSKDMILGYTTSLEHLKLLKLPEEWNRDFAKYNARLSDLRADLGILETEIKVNQNELSERSGLYHIFTGMFALYCVILLFFTGHFADANPETEYRSALNTSLMIFNVLFCCSIFCIFGVSSSPFTKIKVYLSRRSFAYKTSLLLIGFLSLAAAYVFHYAPNLLGTLNPLFSNLIGYCSLIIPLLGPTLYLLRIRKISRISLFSSEWKVERFLEISNNVFKEIDFLIHVASRFGRD